MGKGDTVKLISAEGAEFIVDIKAASISNTIKSLLHSDGALFNESKSGEIRFPEIRAVVLEKICQYFYYKLQYTNNGGSGDFSISNVPNFDIQPETALELLMAANYLDT